jgi:hypothetical protein
LAILLLNYSRSGGTLLSSILGKFDNVVLVSEVNPTANATSSVKEQVKDWYGIEIANGSYTEMITELNEYCLLHNKTLVIRDFSFVDFTPHALNGFEVMNRFSSIQELKNTIPLKVFSFVRNAFDIWISRNCPPHFSIGYLNYVEQLISLQIPIFKYEDFCNNSETELAKICDFIGIKYNKQHLQTPNNYQNITGDNLMKAQSRGRLLNQITPLKRKQIPRLWIKKISTDLPLKKANKLLSYDPNFNAVEMEQDNLEWINYLKWTFYRYQNPSLFHEF